jgi:nitrous oxidase accessory protein
MHRLIATLVALVVSALISHDVALAAEDLQALIDHAEPGAVLVLGPGTYDGNVQIDKPLELRGEGWPIVDAHGEGNVITITAPDVTITGLVIANTGISLDRENAGISVDAPRVTIVNNRFENVLFGAFLRRAVDSYVADNVIGAMDLDVARRGDGIRLWESSRTVVERNVVDGGRDTVLWFSDDLILRDNSVTNGRYGIHFMYSDRALVERNYLGGNSVGGFLMYSHDLVLKDNVITGSHGPSGYGIGLKDMDGVTVTGNHLTSNRVGIYFDNSPSTPGIEHEISGNLFAYNGVGALFLPSVKGNVFSGNGFVDNGEQVGVRGKGDFHDNNVWTVGGTGNHWSDYAGYDADGDGVGDVSYKLADLFSSLTDKNADLHFFDATPASEAIDLAGKMFPTFKPRPKLTDTAPLIELPKLSNPVSTSGPGSTATTAGAAALMLAIAVGLWVVGRAPLRRSVR